MISDRHVARVGAKSDGIRRIRRHPLKVPSIVAVATVVCAGVPATTLAGAGKTNGSFAVSSTGAATYTIPIWAPPGPRGIQPKLSLTYNSQQSIGPLGVGWSLSGLSSIARCEKTVAQDGTAAPVALATGDGYCLDGNRLRLTSGTYGVAGSTYQTEIADFSNITANSAAGQGPGYFTVQRRDGLTYQYGYTDGNGNGSNSRVLAAGTATTWLLSKVSDRSGNNFVINYTSLTGTAVPSTISWTPTTAGGSSYTYVMQFNYTTNVPQSSISKYLAGTLVSNTQLLSSIAISSSGTVIKDYFLGYQSSPSTGRNELTSVKECADAAQSNCLLPTSIAYQGGAAGVSTSATSALSSSGWGLTARYDLNGDGYPDLVVNNGTTWWVAFGAPGGYGTPINTGVNTGNTYILIGNFNGGAEDGFLANQSGTWWYYRWNGSSFAGTSTGLAYDGNTWGYQLADIDGDGRPDLIDLDLASGGLASVNVRLNTSTSSTISFSSTVTTAYTATGVSWAQLQRPDAQYGRLRQYDFNGDGRDDVVLETQTTLNFSGSSTPVMNTVELISSGTAFTAWQISTVSGTTSYTPLFFTNWNDDACTDVVTVQASGTATLAISGCNSTMGASFSVGTVVGVMDWDGDGRSDLIVQNGSALGVYRSTGAGVSSLVTTSVPYNSSCQYVTLDANGDGMDDLGCWNGLTSPYPVSYYAHNGITDLATGFTDGYGVNYSPAYVSLVASGGVYVKGSSAVFPEQDYEGPMHVVSSYVASDGIGGTYTTSYLYSGAIENLRGRGFEGFTQIRSHDSRSGIYTFTSYYTAFPLTGMLSESKVTQSVISNVIRDTVPPPPTVTTLSSVSGQQRYFPYYGTLIVKDYEAGGSSNGQLIRTSSTSYVYDIYGNATSISTTVTDNDSSSPYDGETWTSATTNTPDVDTASWCISLFTETQTVYSASNSSPSVTRTRQLIPDTTNCRYTEVVTEPGSSTYKVTEAFGFDSFGNINTDTVTGIGMAARETTTNWGTTGQVPMSVTNPLGQTTQQNYNFNFVLPSSRTDPNGIQTSWHYDPFGRKDTETRPDGTRTSWVYADCAGAGGCLIGSHALTLTASIYNTDGTVRTDASKYFDQMDRPLISRKRMLANGTWDRNEVRYDSLGRLAQRALPCTWAAVTTACPYWITNTHDLKNRLTLTQRPISAVNSTLQATATAYQGDTVITTDPQGSHATRVITAAGTLGRSQDHYGYYQNFAYDAYGSVVGVSDSLGRTLLTAAYDYGIQAYQRDATDADLDVSTAAGGHRHFTYDALGELTSWSDAKGQSFSQSYDPLGRPLARIEPDLTTTFTYGATAASHNIGRVQSVSANAYVESYLYDTDGRLSTRSVTIPSDATYNYDFAYSTTTGLLDTLTYPTSTSSYRLKLSYSYQNGVLQAVSDFNAGTVYWQADSMNPQGQVTQETLGNGVVTTRSLDAVTGWPSSVTSGVGGTAALQNESYLFDEMGNLTQRQNNHVGLTESFFYDDVYRLDHSTLNGTPNLQMHYGEDGNITSRSDVAGGVEWTYDVAHPHAVTQAGSSAYTYTYDSNGNATSRNGVGITWTSYNHPLIINNSGSGETVQFSYNQNHERWSAIYNSPAGVETTYFIGDLMEKVVQVGSNDFRHYIYAGGTKVAIYSRTTSGVNTLRYVREDHQGSIAAILASDGTSYVKESFTAFGARRSSCTWSGPPTSGSLAKISAVTRRGYTWQTALGNMGLNDMNGRIQDAVTGRFLSADPHVQNPANTQSFNRYSYVLNNPLSYVDPTGFDSQCSEYSVNPREDAGPAVLGDWVENGVEYCTFTVPEVTISGSPEPPGPAPTHVPSAPPMVGGPAGGGGGGGSASGDQQIPCRPGVNCYLPPETTEQQGKQQQQQNQNPCASAANAPSPQQYAAQGAALRAQVNQLGLLPPQFALMAPVTEADVLLNFRRGGSLDAQVLYGGSQGYANYAFGVFMSAAGFSLQATLNGANAYGAFASQYSANQLAGSAATGYPAIPPANVASITAGFNAQQSGNLCTKP